MHAARLLPWTSARDALRWFAVRLAIYAGAAVVAGLLVVAYALFLASMARAQEACVPVGPLFERLVASGLEFEDVTDPVTVRRIAADIASHTEQPFPPPTRIIIAFIGERAQIGIAVDDEICAVLSGPAHAVRMLLRAVHGQSVGGGPI